MTILGTKPKLIPTLFTIPSLIVLCILGTWQLQRLQEKEALIATIEERIAGPAVALPSKIENPSNWYYKTLQVTGEFLYDKEIFLYGSIRQLRGEAGFRIITPLKQANGDVILVDRGWVSHKKKEQDKRPETIQEGIVTVTGALMEGEIKRLFTPTNRLDLNLWYWFDLPAMYQFANITAKPYYFMAQKAADPKALPIGYTVTPQIRNDHLSYACIWFSAALTLLVIYILYHRQHAEKEKKTP